jgi:hypothetical protein
MALGLACGRVIRTLLAAARDEPGVRVKNDVQTEAPSILGLIAQIRKPESELGRAAITALAELRSALPLPDRLPKGFVPKKDIDRIMSVALAETPDEIADALKNMANGENAEEAPKTDTPILILSSLGRLRLNVAESIDDARRLDLDDVERRPVARLVFSISANPESDRKRAEDFIASLRPEILAAAENAIVAKLKLTAHERISMRAECADDPWGTRRLASIRAETLVRSIKKFMGAAVTLGRGLMAEVDAAGNRVEWQLSKDRKTKLLGEIDETLAETWFLRPKERDAMKRGAEILRTTIDQSLKPDEIGESSNAAAATLRAAIRLSAIVPPNAEKKASVPNEPEAESMELILRCIRDVAETGHEIAALTERLL